MDPVFAGEGKRFVIKEKREVFVEFAVVGRGGSASMEGRGPVALNVLSDCEVCERSGLGARWLAFRLRIWSS
jgi:hypothetical protein